MIIRNKGFNLIELMISILVASIIVGGLYSLMTSSVVNFGFSRGSAVAGSSSRRIDVTFNALLFQTGYVNYLRVMQDPHFTATTVGNGLFNGWAKDQVVAVQKDTNKQANGSDMIKIRFYGSSVADNVSSGVGSTADGYIYDCMGQPVENTKEMELVFYVRSNGLICHQRDLSHNDSGQNVVVDPNVAHMRIQVGTSVGGAVGQAGANSSFYRVGGKGWKDDAISSAVSGSGGSLPTWPQINLVRYALVLSVPSGQQIIKQRPAYNLFPDDNSVVYQVPDDATAMTNNVNDRENRVHRVVNGNVQIINKL
jgi:prepilin-type N-terminal cleavage/methylation domain-containing protein